MKTATADHTTIKTFEDAAQALNQPATLPDVSSWPTELQKFALANYKMVIIAKALNGGWEPNWDNNEWKYAPWFNMDSASCFSSDDFVHDFTLSSVGSRLCFKSREIAKYAATQFIDVYRDLFTTK